jgi:hypothetical protein
MTFERIVEMTPAFDRRNSDPSKNYGIHGVELRMVLKGERGATQFLLYTNWQLPHVTREFDERKPFRSEFPHLMCHPLPADLGYHSPVPLYQGQEKMSACEYVEGGCYYDGSSTNAERIYNVLLREGSAGVWRELEAYYNETFSEATADVAHAFGGHL